MKCAHPAIMRIMKGVDGVGCAKFLVTYAPGGNNPPRADFAPVEATIRLYAK